MTEHDNEDVFSSGINAALVPATSSSPQLQISSGLALEPPVGAELERGFLMNMALPVEQFCDCWNLLLDA